MAWPVTIMRWFGGDIVVISSFWTEHVKVGSDVEIQSLTAFSHLFAWMRSCDDQKTEEEATIKTEFGRQHDLS